MFEDIKRFKDYLRAGKRLLNDQSYIEGQRKSILEQKKSPTRTDIINYLVSILNRETTYLEIGVRNPDHNFNHIKSRKKYGVDPGVEFKENPVEFKMTSDEFFSKLDKGEVLSKDTEFDVIFIDGLHLAEQVDRDIKNALANIRDDGFIVLHDCNPPTCWHSREEYGYAFTPAQGNWNGTTWKAFLKWRSNPKVNSCCIDTDWGVGVLSKKQAIGASSTNKNPFFEYSVFDQNRKESLNLMTFDKFKAFFE